MNDMNVKSESTDTVLKWLESNTGLITKVLGFITGLVSILYLFGYVIVNSRLLSLGVRDFSLTNPLYLSAGTLFLIFHSIISAAPVLLVLFSPKVLEVDIKIARNRIFLYSGISFLVTIVLLMALGDFDKIYHIGGFRFDFNSWIFIYAIYNFGLLFFLLMFLILHLRGTTRFVAYLNLSTYVYLFLIAMMLYMWGNSIYPYIKASYGGGKPIKVQLVANNTEQADLIKQTGIEFVSPYTTDIIELIDDNGETFLVVCQA